MALAFHALSESMNTNSCELLTLSGHLDPSRLREAIGGALGRHPLANATLVRKGRWGRLAWRVAPAPLPIDLRIHQTSATDEEELRAELMDRVWSEEIPLFTSRPIRFHLTYGRKQSYFQIVAPHVVTDARSGALIAQDIADAYTALEAGQPYQEAGVPFPTTPHQSLVRELPRWKKALLILRAIVGVVRDAVAPDSGLPSTAAPRESTRLEQHDLGAGILKQVLSTSRRVGVTAHAMFSLAVLRARERVREDAGLPPSTLRVMDLCTIRHLCSDDLGDCFDVLVVPYSTRLVPGWTNDEALRRISRRVDALKKGAILVDYYRLWLLTLVEPFVSKRWLTKFVCKHVLKTNLSTTNPGVVPVPLEAFGSTPVKDFINFPQALVPAEVIMIYTTYRGRLRLLTVSDDGAFPEGTKVLIGYYREELNRLLDNCNQQQEQQGRVAAA